MNTNVAKSITRVFPRIMVSHSISVSSGVYIDQSERHQFYGSYDVFCKFK